MIFKGDSIYCRFNGRIQQFDDESQEDTCDHQCLLHCAHRQEHRNRNKNQSQKQFLPEGSFIFVGSVETRQRTIQRIPKTL